MFQKRKNNNYYSIEGKFLVASPNMSDPRFSETLIYMISDDIKGSMGIIVNKPALNLDITKIFSSQKKINKSNIYTIHYGGPVEFDRGFILHTNDYKKSKGCKTFCKF